MDSYGLLADAHSTMAFHGADERSFRRTTAIFERLPAHRPACGSSGFIAIHYSEEMNMLYSLGLGSAASVLGDVLPVLLIFAVIVLATAFIE
jgi:hypothetical protein